MNAMTIDERRARALGLSLAIEAATGEAIVSITSVIPPAEAAAYHNALLAQFQAFHDFAVEQRPALEGAKSAADFKTHNATFGLAVQETENEVIAANQLISDDARTALAACLGT